MEENKFERIRRELKNAGVGFVGMRTPEAGELSHILHDNEHIGGVVYGKYEDSLAWLIATDQRVIFLNKKPLFKTQDEFTYDVVSGIKNSKSGLLNSIVLHTKIGDYMMTYITAKCARIFVQYIEERRVGSKSNNDLSKVKPRDESSPDAQDDENQKAFEFLSAHEVAVLSTLDRTGNVHGSTIYYTTTPDNLLYFVTKSGTEKSHNILAQCKVALTVYEEQTLQTVQVQGAAEVEVSGERKETIFRALVKERVYVDHKQMPPVTDLHVGMYTVIKVTPTSIRYSNYSEK